jgi:hypothetical protein
MLEMPQRQPRDRTGSLLLPNAKAIAAERKSAAG